MSYGWYYERYQPSRPKEAKGGIKAQSKKGSFGTSWWAKRWIAVLESFNIGARLGRGRSYARKGQVLSIDIEKGLTTAKVQGSQSRPYSITIKTKVLIPSDWEKLAKEVSHQAIFAAKLLAGEMPQDIEEVFKKVGLSLFPERGNDLMTNCSCPDSSNPCKHIAAAYYLLGEEFDRDPFLIFKLRGMSKEELVELLGHDVQEEKEVGQVSGQEQTDILQEEPLPSDSSSFWEGGSMSDNMYGDVHIPTVSAVLLKRLGHFPFWRGEKSFIEAFEPTYVEASQSGLKLMMN
ncbi:MAG: SWIM zinc finger family protein [bacterium]